MFLILISLVLVLIIYKLYKFLTKNLDYWEKRNVPHPKPKLLFGNFMDYVLLRKPAPIVTSEICEQFPDAPYVGVFYGTEPALVIKDPEIIKLVMMKDFYYFNGREITDYAHKETITKNLFFNAGDEWRVCRQNLTSIFTSAKLKMMFPLIQNCAKEFETFIADEVKMTQTVDIKSLITRYTMECIINCAFGLNANTMKKIDGFNPFIVMSDKIFDTSTLRGLKMATRAMWPSLFYGFGLKLFDDKIVSFFQSLFNEVTIKRSGVKSSRNDFIDLISNWKTGAFITGDSISNLKTGEKKSVKIEANDELLVAQCILLFAAGFETTSSTINFLLFELAKNRNVQERVIEEVDEYLKKHNDVIEYDCVYELPYIEACLDEALRLYPILGVVTREVWDNYTMPTGLKLQKGDRIHIPIQYLHRNPEFFQNPEEFLPERFYGDEKKNIKPFTFLPFGEGPRICIGIRFAKMTLFPSLLTLFKNYRIELAENMPTKLEYKPSSIVTQAVVDLQFKFIPRNN